MDSVDKYGDSSSSQAYVLATLSLGVVKCNINEFSRVGMFQDKAQEDVIELGCKLLCGDITAEKYVTEFEKLALKLIDKADIKFDDYVKEQIKMRVANSHGMFSKDKKKLKEDIESLKAQQLDVLDQLRALRKEPFTPEKIALKKKFNDITNELKKSPLEEAEDFTPKINSFLQANPHSTYNSILAHLGIDPKSGRAIPIYHAVKKLLDGGAIQREKVGKGFAYSVKGTAPAPQPIQTQPVATTQPVTTTPIVASKAKVDYKPTILDFIKANPKATAGQVLAKLGVAPGTALQIPVYKAMQDLLLTGALARTKEGKLFQYSIGDGTPVQAVPKVKKPKSIDQILSIVNANWNYRGRTDNGMPGTWQGDEYSRGEIYFDTTDRGPRTDHGGGDDGDGWMSPSQVERYAKPYRDKWMPRLKELIKVLKKNKIVATNPYVDYGEKGLVSLGLKIN